MVETLTERYSPEEGESVEIPNGLLGRLGE